MIITPLVTYKIRYSTTDEGNELVHRCMNQYSSMLHFAYNRTIEGKSETEIKHSIKELNNLDLMDTLLGACAAKEARFISEIQSDKNQKLSLAEERIS